MRFFAPGDAEAFSRELAAALAVRPAPLTPDERTALTWAGATERLFTAAALPAEVRNDMICRVRKDDIITLFAKVWNDVDASCARVRMPLAPLDFDSESPPQHARWPAEAPRTASAAAADARGADAKTSPLLAAEVSRAAS